jgi:putative FmdB family regulatory protein
MPTYDYKCKHCKHEFEDFQPITADPLRVCPKCNKNGLERLIGAGAGIIFRGSGFYITDYKRGGASSASQKATESTVKTPSSASPTSPTDD